MRPLRLTFVTVLCLGAAATFVACGGDDSPEQAITVPTSTTTETTADALTKTDFIAQADPICEEANTAIQAFADAGQGLTEADEIARLRADVVSQLNALGPPEEDAATLQQFLAALEAQVGAGEKIALANERGTDTAQFETELQAAKDEAATAASTYGFQSCGSDITSSSSASTDDSTVVPAEPTAPAAEPTAPDTSGGGVGNTDGDTGSGGGVSPGGGVGPG